MLLASSTFLQIEMLGSYGFFIFVGALGMITLGLRPYRALRKLEMCPNEIRVSENFLTFVESKKTLFSVPIRSVETVNFIETSKMYGIGIALKNPLPEKIVVHRNTFDMKRFVESSQSKWGNDLFFDYFSRRAFKFLTEQCHAFELDQPTCSLPGQEAP